MSRRFTLSRGWPLLAALGVGMLAILAVVAIGQNTTASAQGSVTIGKTASQTQVHANDVVTYTITVTNTDTTNAQFVRVTDVIPFGVSYVAGSATNGATYSSGVVTWERTLSPGETQSFTFAVTVAQHGTAGPFPIHNTACIEGGSCSSVTIRVSWYRVYLPIVGKGYAWCPPWPFDFE